MGGVGGWVRGWVRGRSGWGARRPWGGGAVVSGVVVLWCGCACMGGSLSGCVCSCGGGRGPWVFLGAVCCFAAAYGGVPCMYM